MSWSCELWENELLYRLQYKDYEDEKYAKGMYDMAIDIAVAIEGVIGKAFDDKDIDMVVETIYNAIKYGERVG